MGVLIGWMTTILRAVMIFLLIIVVVMAVYIVRNKQRRKIRVVDDKVTTNLKRTDAMDYLRFDTIKDNMIIADGGKRFIGIIRCFGFDLFSASAATFNSTINGYRNFIASIRRAITYRQYTKQANLQPTKKKYDDGYNKLLQELYNATDDYSQMRKELELIRGTDIVKERVLLGELEVLQEKINSLVWKEFHMRDEIAYFERISGVDSVPETVESYVFDWTYYPYDYVKDLTEEEVYKEALVRLAGIEKDLVYGLREAGVSTERVDGDELIDMCKLHFNPITAERFKMQKVEHTSFYDDVITSTCIEDAKVALQEEIISKVSDSYVEAVKRTMEQKVTEMEHSIAV